MASAATTAERNLASAEAYYTAMKHNDAETMAKYLHPDVDVVSPMGELRGKERVLEAAKGLMLHIMDLEIKARLASGEQVMLVYDMFCSEPIGTCRTAALMTFKDGLIVRNDLFFDPRPFLKS
jgi:hypothetical protein